MDRREMLRTLGVLGAAAAPAAMVAQQAAHVHGTADHQALIAASSNCVVKGEACMAHCQQMLAAGDKSMLPDCPRLGIEMVTLCGALRTLAAQDAPSLPKLAAVTMDACSRCETHCRKSAKTMTHCKECADACAACVAECRKIAKT